MDVPKRISVRAVRVTPRTCWTFAMLETRDGVTGFGEATQSGMEPALLDAARVIAPRARCASIDRPAAFADAMAPRTLPEAAIVSAIDHALWDVHAQARGAKLGDALGGTRREPVAVYANFNRRIQDRSPAGFAASARDAVRAGYGAFKIAPFDEVHV